MSKHKLKPKIEVSEEQLKQVVVKEIKAELFRGPIPSPVMIEKYAKLYPGAPEFFFTIMQKQMEHRMSLEGSVVRSNITGERIGQIFAFILCLVAIGSGVFLIMNNKDAAGISSILLSLGGIIGMFFVRKQRSRSELKKKF